MDKFTAWVKIVIGAIMFILVGVYALLGYTTGTPSANEGMTSLGFMSIGFIIHISGIISLKDCGNKANAEYGDN